MLGPSYNARNIRSTKITGTITYNKLTKKNKINGKENTSTTGPIKFGSMLNKKGKKLL
jgi:hypothetical protein